MIHVFLTVINDKHMSYILENHVMRQSIRSFPPPPPPHWATPGHLTIFRAWGVGNLTQKAFLQGGELSRPRANILSAWPSRLVNKVYIYNGHWWFATIEHFYSGHIGAPNNDRTELIRTHRELVRKKLSSLFKQLAQLCCNFSSVNFGHVIKINAYWLRPRWAGRENIWLSVILYAMTLS